MRDFPSCFGENGIQIADSSFSNGTKNAQNLVTCIYHSKMGDRPCSVTVTWNKNMMGQGMGVSIDDDDSCQCICKVDIKPWLFSKRKGSKSLDFEGNRKIDVFWDLSSARFGSGPEPIDGFYLAIVVECEMVLLLGDLRKEAYRKTNASYPVFSPVFVGRREHIFGKKVYCARSQFSDNGHVHDILIECEMSGIKDCKLLVRIDKRVVVQVSMLQWKFRGNETVLVDGLSVEVLWDVYNWFYNQTGGSGVFMFQTRQSIEKLWMSQNGSLNSSELMLSQMLGETQPRDVEFSLVLYVWKSE